MSNLSLFLRSLAERSSFHTCPVKGLYKRMAKNRIAASCRRPPVSESSSNVRS